MIVGNCIVGVCNETEESVSWVGRRGTGFGLNWSTFGEGACLSMTRPEFESGRSEGVFGVEVAVTCCLNFEGFDLMLTWFGAACVDCGASSPTTTGSKDDCPRLIRSPGLDMPALVNDSSASFKVSSFSLSLSSAATRLLFSSLPVRIAPRKVVDGSVDEINVAKEFEAGETRLALKRDVDGFGGGEARVASSGTSFKYGKHYENNVLCRQTKNPYGLVPIVLRFNVGC
jgi:hypothetical protein